MKTKNKYNPCMKMLALILIIGIVINNSITSYADNHTHNYTFDHAFVSKAPTFTEKGSIGYWCTECGVDGLYRDVPPLGDANLKPGMYMIQYKIDENKYVSVTPGQSYAKGNIAIYGKGKADQLFHVIPNGDGTYGFSYTNASNEQFMIDLDSAAFSGNVMLWNPNGYIAQQWYVVPDNEGWNTIVSRATYYVFDAVNFGTADGTNIGSYYCWPGDAQKYKFILIECDNHNWDSGKVETEPTETKKGVRKFTCTDCGKTKTEDIPAKGGNTSNNNNNGNISINIKRNQTISKVKNITKTYSTKKFRLGAVTDGNGKISYSSSNKKVATVSADGQVKLIGAGKTKITIKASGTSTFNPAEKTITLTVNRTKQKITSKVKTKTMTYTSTPFSLGTKVQGNAKVTYKSSNPKVLTVSKKGKVALKGIGKATITIKTKQNAQYAAGTKKIVITVKPPKVKLIKCTPLSDCRVKISWTDAPVFDGYEIQFSQDSKFSEGYEPLDYNKKGSSTILRGGAEGRTYYVRVRPYCNVNGKKVRYAWSNASSFKTYK